MKNVLLIFLGGGLGSVLRYLISFYTQNLSSSIFPWGTLIVNVTGSFLIGFLSSILLNSNSSMKFLLIVGFCGGFTTFSAFSLENIVLWENGSYRLLIFYSVLSVIMGATSAYIGYNLVKN